MAGLIVAIDGPAGAGKSTVSRLLAERLGYRLLDTGALYRAVALVASERGVDFGDEAELAEIARRLDIDFRLDGDKNRVLLGARDVSDDIRSPEMSQGASRVSSFPAVRTALLGLQRALGKKGGVVAEGRDIGTVVFPDAPAKFFLTASPEIRARRRVRDLESAGHEASYAQTLAEIIERDRRDSERATAPLKAADDALHVDSSELSADKVVDAMMAHVRQQSG